MLLLWLLACRPPAAPRVEEGPEVRFRPGEPAGELAQLVSRVPGATWDRNLQRAAELLIAAARGPGARLTPRACADALAAAGYPGNARFAREYNGGAFPDALVDSLALAALERPQPVDLALSRRSFSDGGTLWVAGLAHRPALLDPLPRDLTVDTPLPVGVEWPAAPPLTLLLVAPGQPVRTWPLTPGRALWVDEQHVPGAYRLAVLAGEAEQGQVALQWTHFVDSPATPPLALPEGPTEQPDPMAATEALYTALDRLRAEAGLPRVQRFPTFEPLAREHAARLAARGQLAHALPGVPAVSATAAQRFHPPAAHHEALAAALTWEEAQDLVELSPAHLRTLLCAPCTHAAIGVALEPTLDHVPRLFVVWELLETPSGLPGPVPTYR